MAKSSINFKPVKENSEIHNLRKTELNYNFNELVENNEHWILQNIQSKTNEVKKLVKTKTGRAMQKKATPIREAVLNLNAHHTMDDLKKLAHELEEKKGISTFQIHIHRDEGKNKNELNYHAHMLFNWINQDGKSYKLNRIDMSEIQTIVANSLQMQRGELKENSNRERLEPIEYKRNQEEKRLQALKTEISDLSDLKKKLKESLRSLIHSTVTKLKMRLSALTPSMERPKGMTPREHMLSLGMNPREYKQRNGKKGGLKF